MGCYEYNMGKNQYQLMKLVEIQKYKEVSDKTIRTLITRLYKKRL